MGDAQPKGIVAGRDPDDDDVVPIGEPDDGDYDDDVDIDDDADEDDDDPLVVARRGDAGQGAAVRAALACPDSAGIR